MPTREGAMLRGEAATLCKVEGHSGVSCAKVAKWSRCCLGCGLGWSKEARIRWSAHWRHLVNTVTGQLVETPTCGLDI